MSPPSTQSIRAKNVATDGGSSKMTPIEIAQQGGTSSLYWSHNLVSTTHLGAITSISCSENGMIAIASEDQTISVIHLAALLASIPSQTNLGAQLSASMRSKSSVESYVAPTVRLHEHTQGIVQLKISSDGRVFSISKDHTLKISDASSQSRIASFSFPSALTGFALSPNEEVVYVGAQDGNIYKLNLWDIISRPSSTSSSSSNAISSSANAFGSNYDWSSSISSSLAEWSNAEVGQEENGMMDVTGSNASHSRSQQKPINLGDVEPNAFRGHTQPISSISISLDCSRVVSSAMDGTVIIWDERTCQMIHRVSPIKGVGVAWSHVICRPSSSSTSGTSKFRLDSAQKEKSSLPFALVPKPQSSVGAPYGFITAPLGDSNCAAPESVLVPSGSATSFLQLDFNQILMDLNDTVSTQAEVYQFGVGLAERLQASHASEVDNLKEEVARLKAMNEKWKQVNNSLFSSTLSSTLK
jgi:hypothetical protein